jgi:hypothetical protein
MVIDGWVGCINWQIITAAYMAEHIANLMKLTLGEWSSREMHGNVGLHSIWRQVSCVHHIEGRIHRDCQQHVFPGGNVYTV